MPPLEYSLSTFSEIFDLSACRTPSTELSSTIFTRPSSVVAYVLLSRWSTTKQNSRVWYIARSEGHCLTRFNGQTTRSSELQSFCCIHRGRVDCIIPHSPTSVISCFLLLLPWRPSLATLMQSPHQLHDNCIKLPSPCVFALAWKKLRMICERPRKEYPLSQFACRENSE